ncbi:hypothetical protein ACFLS1_09525, partial [Verrucomicrobiota bacterium]
QGNIAAINLKTRTLSDLGGVSLALDFAETHKTVINPETLLYLKSNMAASRINWGEPDVATNILDELISEESEKMIACWPWRQWKRWRKLLRLMTNLLSLI